MSRAAAGVAYQAQAFINDGGGARQTFAAEELPMMFGSNVCFRKD